MNKVMVLRPGELGFVDQPDPEVGARDVAVRIKLSGLSSRSEIERYARNPAGKPEQIGYNVVGVVESVGDDVVKFRAGDRVYASVGHTNLAVIAADQVIKIPDGVDDESAC